MTNNPTIDGVSRELLERATDNKYIDKERISIYRHEALCGIRALLAAPAVERQEPTPAMTDAGCQAYMDAYGMIGIMHNSSMGHAYVAMRALDPEFAALKSTIAQLRIDLSNQTALTKQADYHASQRGKELAQLQARVQELESGSGEPLIHIAPEALAMLKGERRATHGGLTYSESKPLGNWTVPLFTDPPAPVTQQLDEPTAYLRNEGTPNNLVVCEFDHPDAFKVFRVPPAPSAGLLQKLSYALSQVGKPGHLVDYDAVISAREDLNACLYVNDALNGERK
ncbi:hypothetical protein K5E40_03650 [Pseudomonas baetica]|uniref:hypothetical protein n=1 Tax=Pseudomonas baetica TaxID=674054 RepID=UPI001C8C4791|nr:hypothetical protein [Pseudomonas baetica]MBX9404769.1 hypothetical protein [Pseudomonas baetica]